MTHPRTRPILTGLLGITVLSTCVAVASPANAAEGDTFTAPAVTVTGTAVPTVFAIDAEPQGNTPGAVQIGDGTTTAIPRGAAGDLQIPETVEHGGKKYRVAEIADGAFRGATAITQTGLDANASVERIGDFAFARATSLTDTGLADNTTVTAVGVGAFSSIPALNHGALPASLTSAPSMPFSSSVNLRSVYLPAAYDMAVRVGVQKPVETYVRAGADGWGAAAEKTFNGLGLFGSQPRS